MDICLGSESNANVEELFHWVNGIPRKKTPNLTWSVTLLNLFPDEFVTITTFKSYYIQYDVCFVNHSSIRAACLRLSEVTTILARNVTQCSVTHQV